MQQNLSGRALVLSGGGPVGRAWHMGLAAGLLDAGVDLRHADLIVGTSAGAVVGARLALGIDPRSWDLSIDAAVSGAPSADTGARLSELMAGMVRAVGSAMPDAERAAVGRMALAADTISEDASLARITFDALRAKAWPAAFRATAVAAKTGAFRAFGPADGVALERGVAASAALPIAWPPITVDGERYIDGGVRSMLNADLAAGHAAVVVVSCLTLDANEAVPAPVRTLNSGLLRELEGLRASGAIVALVEPSAAFRSLTAEGTRLLDPSIVGPAYALGREAALDQSESIQAVWSA